MDGWLVEQIQGLRWDIRALIDGQKALTLPVLDCYVRRVFTVDHDIFHPKLEVYTEDPYGVIRARVYENTVGWVTGLTIEWDHPVTELKIEQGVPNGGGMAPVAYGGKWVTRRFMLVPNVFMRQPIGLQWQWQNAQDVADGLVTVAYQIVRFERV